MAEANQETEQKNDDKHLKLFGVCVDDSEHSARAFDCEYQVWRVVGCRAYILGLNCLTAHTFIYWFFELDIQNVHITSSTLCVFILNKHKPVNSCSGCLVERLIHQKL